MPIPASAEENHVLDKQHPDRPLPCIPLDLEILKDDASALNTISFRHSNNIWCSANDRVQHRRTSHACHPYLGRPLFLMRCGRDQGPRQGTHVPSGMHIRHHVAASRLYRIWQPLRPSIDLSVAVLQRLVEAAVDT